MRSKKKRPIIAAGDVEGIFNDAQVAELAKIAKLPSGADLAALAEGVRKRRAFSFTRPAFRTATNCTMK